MCEVKYPEVEVQLSGGDGNAFAIIGAVQRALRNAERDPESGVPEGAAAEYAKEAMESDSYDGLLQHAMRTVQVA